jgi:hypothetical protein
LNIQRLFLLADSREIIWNNRFLENAPIELSMRKTTEFSLSFPIEYFQKFSNFSVGGRVVAGPLQERSKARRKGAFSLR